MGRVRAGGAAIVLALVAAMLVSGCGSSDADANRETEDRAVAVEALEPDAMDQYKVYLEGEADRLVETVGRLGEEIDAEFRSATFPYAEGRVYYNHLLPTATQLGAQAAALDGRPEQPDGELTGFHRVEQDLFGREDTTALGPVVRRMDADSRALRRAIVAAELSPSLVARGIPPLMEEISTRMIQGEGQPYSRLDLIDVSAAVEGADHAFQALRPQLANSDVGYVLMVEAAFVEVYEGLEGHGDPARNSPPGEAGSGDSYIVYNYLDPADVNEIAIPLRELTALLRELPGRLQDA